MLKLDKNKLWDGVYYLSEDKNQPFDDNLYIELRKKECRLYSDREIEVLPYRRVYNHLDYEWKVRAGTFEKLVNYFKAKRNLNILEIGCGNGWLSNGIAGNTDNYVVGVDLNKKELTQAARVFVQNEKLTFVFGNIFEDIFPPRSFDAAILASSVQYFPDLTELINRVFYFLRKKGEVHIIDSNFYRSGERYSAKSRTESYYENLGFPGMSRYYHHHTWDELSLLNYKIQNKVSFYLTRLMNILPKNDKIIFPWIKILKS